VEQTAIFLFQAKHPSNPRQIRILEKGGTGGTEIPYRAIKNSGVTLKNTPFLKWPNIYPSPLF
jgi:hypothetical protein